MAGLFQNAVKVRIETSRTLEVLSHHSTEAQEDAQRVTGLPTWCPDWTIMRGMRILLWPNGYEAAANHNERAFFGTDEGTLALRGKIFGRATWLKVFESDDFDHMTDIYRVIPDIQLAAPQMAKLGASRVKSYGIRQSECTSVWKKVPRESLPGHGGRVLYVSQRDTAAHCDTESLVLQPAVHTSGPAAAAQARRPRQHQPAVASAKSSSLSCRRSWATSRRRSRSWRKRTGV